MLDLEIRRETSTKVSTPGTIWVDKVYECYSLEDPVRETFSVSGKLNPATMWKIPRQTAIGSGRYQVVLDHSPRFSPKLAQKLVWWKASPAEINRAAKSFPHIIGVDGFSEIRIHWGDKADDTEGCPLVGKVRNSLDEILQSFIAFLPLWRKMIAAEDSGHEIWITITPAPQIRLNSMDLLGASRS